MQKFLSAALILFLLVSGSVEIANAKKSDSNSKASTKQSVIKKAKKKIPAVISTKKTPQGTWSVVSIWSGQSAQGPFSPNTIWPVSDYGFTVTFTNKGFCTTHWEDPINAGKPHCEEPLVFNKDGSFSGKDGRLQAFGGFIKLSGSQLEWYEGGMGFTKYVLEKKN